MSDRATASGAMARADAAHQKIEDHEKLCAERYANIHSTLGELKTGQRGHSRAAWGIVLALLGWMAAQVWTAGQTRIDRLERAPVAAAPR